MADTYDIPVAKVVQETPTDRSFVLPVPHGATDAFRFVPGQFLTITDPQDDVVPPRRRAYSISSSPTDAGALEVTVRDFGAFGTRFYAFPVGKVLRVVPPRGRFTLDERVPGELVLAAGGSGVAPYRGFVRYLRAHGHDRPVTLHYSARVPQDLVFDAEFRRQARECPWFTYAPTVTRLDAGTPFDGGRGRVTAEVLRAHLREPATALLYACGPNAFVDATLAAAATLGLPPANLRKERWG